MILAGRAINDYMPRHVAQLTIKSLNEASKIIKGSKVLIMGLTFKENVDDTRETPVKEIIKELKEFQCEIYGYDPMISKEEIEKFSIKSLDNLNNIKVDCVIITVVHDYFKTISLDNLIDIMNIHPILIDVRGFYSDEAEKKDIIYQKL
ncbi:UDP-N-acetyl-D-mannosamine dehydrogenase [uncultured archaeon]|nr:UDP-N-acetyl-D-mannosamine dehydrogenase [uncultured archaeon]